MMETRLRVQQKAAPPPSFTPARGGVLQRKCACGGTPGPTGECEACRQKKLQRAANHPASLSPHPSEIPPIVHEVLRSSGQPLDTGTRAFMEPRFGHDFSKVRISSTPYPAPNAVTINPPGDPFEQEADRIAARVMQSPASEPSASHKSYDFSRVRVHTDAQAADSARSVNALAYTVGRDIIFDSGQYAPQTSVGQQLIAHELVHVVQQEAATTHPAAQPTVDPMSLQASPRIVPGTYSIRLITEQGEQWITPPIEEIAGGAEIGLEHERPGTPKTEEKQAQDILPVQRMPRNSTPTIRIQRTAKFTQPTPSPQDPLARLAQGLTPGLTTAKINGTASPTLQQLTTDIAPSQVKQTGSSGGNVTCAVDNFNVETTAEQIVASAAPAGGWKGNVPPGMLANPPQCAKVAQVPVSMNAQPSNADFIKRVQASEDEHVADLKVLHDRHFIPYDKFISALSGTGKDLSACGQNLVGQLNNRHLQAAYALAYGWKASLRKLDGPGGTHNDTARVSPATDCSSATVTLSQTTPTIAGAAPGNVVTVQPTVTNFDPKKLKVDGNDLKDDKTVVKTFTNAANAQAALAVIQHYGMTSRNVIDPMEYFLVGSAAPRGPLKGANEIAIDPARYQVTFDLPNAGDWAIADAMGAPTGINLSVIVNFGANRDQAYSGWAVLTSFGFICKGWVGGTRQNPEMMYFRV